MHHNQKDRGRALHFRSIANGDYARMSEFITRRKLHPAIDRVFALEDYQAALDYMGSNAFVGKIVLKL